ncbi:TonB-dependent receptor [Sphingomonas mollis]|uniref:TonB-dependent receptor n=1 Tax=Sphingomonas mollis TaxID=2795726 RepID=A0ABS0XTY0_9SPHN|nr:TonB-dependent receptor [Sphingomonas sp. BT553]MBJ6123508.1 TonB-dependent receptor [Sphingomonas sp. BT553]
MLPSVLLSLSVTHPVAAHAASRRQISVAAVSLDRAIAILAQQAGVDIGSAESGLGRVATRGVRGRLTAAAALDRLLAGTPFVAKQLAPDSFRIVRRPPPLPRQSRPVRATPKPPVEPAPEIVVTATKRDTSRLRFPGALTVLRPGGGLAFGDDAANGMDQAIAASPILQSTALGAGRNKLFIRGVADSSFTGPTQTTANVYFGEVPVAYNGPDPGLNLYDVDQVEVLEGPQGTLYGAGAIGGIVRLVPHAVDLSQVAADMSGGIETTKSGEPGGDIAAMVNLPISTGVLGLRAVGYQVAEGGYIDDVRRGMHDVNGTTTTGTRIDLRAAPAAGWTIDAGMVAQWVSARDLQYAERGLPALSRASLLAQPYDQRYLLGRVVLDKRWDDGLHLVSATGIVSRDADSRFDATRPARPNAPIAYDTEERSRLLSHETRLSRTGANGAGWLVGFAVIHARDTYARAYGAPDRLRPITGVTNRTLDTALFGEIGMALSPSFTLTTGGRITHQRTDGDPIDGQRTNAYIRGRSVTRIDPTIGASWLVAPSVAAYARYQSGFRTGGITVASGVGRVADLKPDTIRVAEIGIRKDRRGTLGLAGSVGLSLTDWRNIQADLVDRLGFPFTANIGDSRIRGVEASANWVPLAGLRVDLAMFFNDTAVAAADTAPRYKTGVRLPNTPPFALSAGVGYRWSIDRDGDAGVEAGWRYVGRSTVGTQAPLDVSQGEFGTGHLGGSWATGKLRLTATLDNVFDVKGDRFAGGNPFVLTRRTQYTPLRPRTLKLGASIAW